MIGEESLNKYMSLNDEENTGEIFLGEPSHKRSSVRKNFVSLAAAALLTYLAAFAIITPMKTTSPLLQLVNPFNLISLVAGAAPAPTTNITEVFEILPVLTVPAGSYAAVSLFYNDTAFTSKHLSVEYEAPEVFNFTGALFDLNLSVSGVQEPVVFDLYVDEYPIWRSSSPNPLGTAANSSTTKNVTEFLSLFESDSVITLQLIDGAITGDVNVSLGAVFYNDSILPATSAPATEIDIASIFSLDGPADIIVPLSNKGLPFELPKDKFLITVPQVAENVTVAKAKFFASASEEETTFYSSAINGPMGGPNKGPIRTLNVYLDDVFVGAITPNPILLKPEHIGKDTDSAHSWSPLAAFGSFDALAYEIDLTAILPLLWENDVVLTVEVVSPVTASTIAGPPSVPGPVPPPGVDQVDSSKWLIAGNFFAWSSALVNASVGDILLSDSLASGTGILIAPPFGGIENQIVRSKTSSGIQSQLNFTLFDGSLHNLTFNFNSSAKGVSIKNSRLAGASSTLTYVGSSDYTISVEDESLLSIFTQNVSSSYPLIINEMKATPVAFGPPTNSSLNITSAASYKEKINGAVVSSIHNKLNSTITDLSYSTEVQVLEVTPDSPIPFARTVTAENGVITKDSLVKAIAAQELDFGFLFQEFEDFQNLIDQTFESLYF